MQRHEQRYNNNGIVQEEEDVVNEVKKEEGKKEEKKVQRKEEEVTEEDKRAIEKILVLKNDHIGKKEVPAVQKLEQSEPVANVTITETKEDTNKVQVSEKDEETNVVASIKNDDVNKGLKSMILDITVVIPPERLLELFRDANFNMTIPVLTTHEEHNNLEIKKHADPSVTETELDAAADTAAQVSEEIKEETSSFGEKLNQAREVIHRASYDAGYRASLRLGRGLVKANSFCQQHAAAAKRATFPAVSRLFQRLSKSFETPAQQTEIDEA